MVKGKGEEIMNGLGLGLCEAELGKDVLQGHGKREKTLSAGG